MPSGEEDRRDALASARERAHLLEAITTAVEHPHRVLDVVLEATDADDAVRRLREEFAFSNAQAAMVLDMQFRRVSRLDRQRIADDLTQTRAVVDDLSR